MNLDEIILHIEALIFASERPLTQIEMVDLVAQAFVFPIEPERISVCIDTIKEKYNADCFPFELREIGGGFQFLTKKIYHKTILTLNGEKHLRKLSTSAMETLSIIAYKQPITKSDIEFIRGVSVDYSLQKLLEKDLVMISGRDENKVGKPLIYATTKGLMDYLGINSAQQLPVLKDIINYEEIKPTDASEATPNDGLTELMLETGV